MTTRYRGDAREFRRTSLERHSASWCFAVGLAASFADVASGQTLVSTYFGNSLGDRCGESVAGAGDVDADGFDDVIVGIPGDAALTGLAVVYSGRTHALLHSFSGPAPASAFGGFVRHAGDVNADGYGDVIVGALRDDTAGVDFGSASVFSGLDGTRLHYFTGPSKLCYFGVVSGAGDVDADGYDDLVVGAYFDKTTGPQSGSAFVYSGKTGAQIWKFSGDSPGDLLGLAVDGAGDVDRDGHADILVAAPYDGAFLPSAGTVRIYSGRDGSAILTIHGESAFDNLGSSVSSAGDVNADGWPDVILGASGASVGGVQNGAAYVYSGKGGSRLYAFYGHHDFDYLGWTVDGAGDVDGDGYADFILGSYNAWFGGHAFGLPWLAGKAYVISGREGLELFSVHGGRNSDSFGWSVAGAGDFNGDGLSEIIVGEPQRDRGVTNTGAAEVYSGCPLPPVLYCSSKPNSLGGIPNILFTGTATLDGADDFVLTATGLVPHSETVLLIGSESVATPFAGGTLCVAPPLRRIRLENSDESGTVRFHVSDAWMTAIGLHVGSNVFMQFWSRDAGFAPPSDVALTQGVRFAVCP
ncbi:MAG: FG-GAP-like repeat-containing protein [Planctomycetes bacterium]|nr:FG-GAP-like repeat-containing protein [Planctomycetota bacterium]